MNETRQVTLTCPRGHVWKTAVNKSRYLDGVIRYTVRGAVLDHGRVITQQGKLCPTCGSGLYVWVRECAFELVRRFQHFGGVHSNN